MPDLDRFPHPADAAPPVPLFAADRNIGHGRVFPRPDGHVQSCGGAALCRECLSDEGKRETAVALWTGADDPPRPGGALVGTLPSEAPEFDRTLVRAFQDRGQAFPSRDGRLWTRAVTSSSGAVLCAWDRDGGFHLWGTVEDLAGALLRLADKIAEK